MEIPHIRFRLDFHPRLIDSLRNYSRTKLTADALAGITVGIVALPLAIAFGIASGVTPQVGLITAIIGGLIVSLLGGSSVQIAGPTGAFIVIVYGIIQSYGIHGLIIATLLAGIMLVLMGVFKLGTIIRFIPYPIIVGFTAGIAVTIFSSQVNDLMGLGIEKVPVDFVSKWALYGRKIADTDPWSLIIGVGSVVFIFLWGRVTKRIPGSLAAIFLFTGIVYAVNALTPIHIETIGDHFTITSQLPRPEPVRLDIPTITRLLPPAFTIAFLGAVESLLSATVADGVTGERHNSNTELIAQGAANMIVPIFGGIPVTGAIARTMTNINNGGRTPVSGIIHAVVLLLVLLFLAPLALYIPMPCLAGVLVVVAYNMSEWRTFVSIVRQPRSDVWVLLITFFLTVLLDLTVAIEVGLLMAMVLFMKRMNEVSNISVITDSLDLSGESETGRSDEVLALPAGVEVYEIEGPFFFGIANKFDESMKAVGGRPAVRIIRMRKVPFMDSTGLYNLQTLCNLSRREHIRIVLSGVNPTVRRMLDSSKLSEEIGPANICPHITVAIARAGEIVSTQGCLR